MSSIKNEGKLKKENFEGLQLRKLTKSKRVAFVEVCRNILKNNKANNHEEIIQERFSSYKDNFLGFHLDFSRENQYQMNMKISNV